MAENKQFDGEKRQTRLNLRLTDAEHTMLKSRAEGFGLPMAEFVRVFLLELPKPAKRVHDLPMVDPKLLRQLVSIGNNVNQLTRYAHTVSNDPKQTLDVLSLSFALQKIYDFAWLLPPLALDDPLWVLPIVRCAIVTPLVFSFLR